MNLKSGFQKRSTLKSHGNFLPCVSPDSQEREAPSEIISSTYNPFFLICIDLGTTSKAIFSHAFVELNLISYLAEIIIKLQGNLKKPDHTIIKS